MTDKTAIRQISENEYVVGNNVTSLIEQNIVYVVAHGDQSDKLAIAQSQINHKLANMAGDKISCLIDLNHCGKSSPKARNVWRSLCEEEITKKVAIFGMHPVASVLAAFVMRVTKSNNQQFFKTKEEALDWLNIS